MDASFDAISSTACVRIIFVLGCIVPSPSDRFENKPIDVILSLIIETLKLNLVYNFCSLMQGESILCS